MTKISEMYEGNTLKKIVTENQIAIDHMTKQLEGLDDPTKLYAWTIVKAIVDLQTKEDKSSRDYDVLLKYLKEMESIIWVKQKTWFRTAPSEDVKFESGSLSDR